MPCGDFDANAAWLMFSSIAYINLFALMRMVLLIWWSTARALTVRLRLYDVAGQTRAPCRAMDRKGSMPDRQMMDEALCQV